MALVCPAAKTRNYTYIGAATPKSHRFMQDCTDFQYCPCLQLERTGQEGLGAVLSAGGAQHAARWGRGGGSAVVGVVVVCWRAREDGVSVGGGAAELESPQVLCVDGFVALQYFNGLVHGEPLPLTAYVDGVFPGLQRFGDSQHIHIRPVLPVLVLLKHTKQTS